MLLRLSKWAQESPSTTFPLIVIKLIKSCPKGFVTLDGSRDPRDNQGKQKGNALARTKKAPTFQQPGANVICKCNNDRGSVWHRYI